jgi:hypothetical protein
VDISDEDEAEVESGAKRGEKRKLEENDSENADQ